MQVNGQLVGTFQLLVDGLRDHPDLEKITQIAKMANMDVHNVALCQEFAAVCMSKLVNPTTHPTFKRPIVYAIDAILKECPPNGPYAGLFTKLFSDHGERALADFPHSERPKMEFLFSTWQERHFIPAELAPRLKDYVVGQLRSRAPIVNGLAAPVTGSIYHSQQAMPHAHSQPQLQQSQRIVQPISQQQPHSSASGAYGSRSGSTSVASAVVRSTHGSSTAAAPIQPSIATGAVVSANNQSFADSTFAARPTKTPSDETIRLAIRNEMINLLNQLYCTMQVPNPLTLDQIQSSNPDLFAQLQSEAEGNVRSMLANRATSRTHPAGFSQQRSQLAGARTPFIGSKRVIVTELAPSTGNAAPFVAPSSAVHDNGSSGPMSSVAFHGSHGQRGIEEEHRTRAEAQPPIRAGSQTRVVAPANLIRGYVGEQSVDIELDRVRHVTESISAIMSKRAADIIGEKSTASLIPKLQSLLQRVQSYVDHALQPPELPAVMFGALPEVPIFGPQHAKNMFSMDLPTRTAPAVALVMPVFKVEDLTTARPDSAVKELYEKLPHQFIEDGLRFRTPELYMQHADKMRKSSDFLRKTKTVTRQSRQPYCTIDQWETEFFSLAPEKNANASAGTSSSSTSAVQGGNGNNKDEQFVVPVDEDFRRCPISGEPFRVVKDKDGDELFENAVEIYVTPKNASIFEKARPLNHMLDAASEIRYLIVQKSLVLDPWLAEGKAATLRDVLLHPQCRGFDAELLRKASGDDETDDLFLVL